MGIRIRLVQALIDINERIIFYPKLRKFYRDIFHDAEVMIFDVGMNKGQSIEFFKSISKKAFIHGFEPNPNLFKKLTAKYGKNKSIILNNIGVSSSTGILSFYENIMDETSSFEPLNYDSEYLQKKAKILGVNPKGIVQGVYPVSVIKLSKYIEDTDIRKIDLIKIDTEGHEKACLEGLFDGLGKCSIDYIQLEQHNDDMYKVSVKSEDIIRLLRVNGFEEIIRIKHGFGDFYEIVYKNVKLN